MAKVTNLKRKKNKRNGRLSLSKLKFSGKYKHWSDYTYQIANYLGKELDEEIINQPEKFLVSTDLYSIEINKYTRNETVIKALRRTFKSENGDLYEINVSVGDVQTRIFTIPDGKAPIGKHRGHYQCSGEKWFMINNIRYIYGYLKCIQIVIDEFEADRDIICSRKFKDMSFYPYAPADELYNEEDYKDLFNIFGLKSKTIRMIVDIIIYIGLKDRNFELTEQYNRETTGECARAFETKKNIPDKILHIMENSKFNEDYSYLEIDEDTDIRKFHMIEREWKNVKESLRLQKFFDVVKPQLRFRKLGKHRAAGLYYPTLKCICVDINYPSSFLHELGHYIDYINEGGQLSLKGNFIPILRQYEIVYNRFLLSDDVNVPYLKRKRDYYNTPTEVFARCFEIYLAEKGLNTSFLKDKEELKPALGYFEISDSFKNDIINYYENIVH